MRRLQQVLVNFKGQLVAVKSHGIGHSYEDSQENEHNCTNQQEGALREIRIEGIQEMGEFKRELKNYESTNSLYKN